MGPLKKEMLVVSNSKCRPPREASAAPRGLAAEVRLTACGQMRPGGPWAGVAAFPSRGLCAQTTGLT